MASPSSPSVGPRALNAMNLDMDVKYKSYLDEWESHPNCSFLFAGGDVKQIMAKNQPPNMIEVSTAEYSLICKISEYKKPFISFIDRITMVFGVDLSGHGATGSLQRYFALSDRDCQCCQLHCNGFSNFVRLTLYGYISEDCSCYARWVFTCSGKEYGRRICRIPMGTLKQLWRNSPATQILKRNSSLLPQITSAFGANKSVLETIDELKKQQQVQMLLTDIVNVVNYNCGQIQQLPDSEAQLKSLLPQITWAFGANKSVHVTIDELKKQQQCSDATVVEWANEALQGLGKGAPFSLYLIQNYFSKVASALGKNDNQLSRVSLDFLPFRFFRHMVASF
ncbi:hypothetical protein DVH24_017968 [Malus domestica]|uniref:3-hydroxyisobutyryl-CoA hydrolase n=1 Tax=Malus domestica TaxID=3750 RepID=A0A498KEV2_MALDO|nr:hypothetical protein DVH24_017968 [Malus domestica]